MSVYGSQRHRARFQWAPTLTSHPDSFVITIESPATGDTFDTITQVAIFPSVQPIDALAETLPISSLTGVHLLLEALGEVLPANGLTIVWPNPAEALGEVLPANVMAGTHPAPTEAFGEFATNTLAGLISVIGEAATEAAVMTLTGVLSTLEAIGETLPITTNVHLFDVSDDVVTLDTVTGVLIGSQSVVNEALAELGPVLTTSGLLSIANEVLYDEVTNVLIVRFDQTTDVPPGGGGDPSPSSRRRRRIRRLT